MRFKEHSKVLYERKACLMEESGAMAEKLQQRIQGALEAGLLLPSTVLESETCASGWKVGDMLE